MPSEQAPRVLATNLGYPRIGSRRELKWALEAFWAGRIDEAALQATAAAIRAANWQTQHAAGIDHVPSNDFSLYDHVLDTAVLLGAVGDAGESDLTEYFAHARGAAHRSAFELTKWFDTNYHYLVPEIDSQRRFALDARKPLAELAEARDLGIETRPVILGPFSFCLLSRTAGGATAYAALEGVLPCYEELLSRLGSEGCEWVQIDEPVLAIDLDTEIAETFRPAYERLAAASSVRILLASYFSDLRANLSMALALPVAALHLDLVAGAPQLDAALEHVADHLALSLGVVDGRNVWRADLAGQFALLERALDRLGPERLLVAPSCSLLHLPVDLSSEGGTSGLDPELRGWLSFATDRLREVRTLARGLNEGAAAVAEALDGATRARAARRASHRTIDSQVRARTEAARTDPPPFRFGFPRAEREQLQAERLRLPLLPTTTIGSFPQTSEIRAARRRFRQGELDTASYEDAMRDEIARTVAFQEEIGLDLLVHGEAERTDMVEYFAEHLAGFALSESGWVQSFGSRCVKPPICFGDVARPKPMTLAWSEFAASCTDRPMKGMLTGPLTMLFWSFIRDDEPLETSARQLALAIRDEVADLDANGLPAIQVDEPALREGLPLHRDDQAGYLGWAVEVFRLATGSASPATQLHTHMCYAHFDDVLDTIVAFDVDVISLEAARSRMALLTSFAGSGLSAGVGPGIWDVHSPEVPGVEQLAWLIREALAHLPASQLWINPDCGLKTRSWAEVTPALANLVAATREVRSSLT